MSLPIRILSTDFDGTVHSEHEDPPVPARLQQRLAALQSRGVTWVINTGRDLSSLMETLGRARLPVWPDYVVTVEREIHIREHGHYAGLREWNEACDLAHARLFGRIRADMPRLVESITARFEATVYEDAWSPFCLIAQNNSDADAILRELDAYCATVPDLTVVRNDVYARFSHRGFNKGTALGEIARRLGVSAAQVVAAGDHANDLPMLSRDFAHHLIAPANAIPAVQAVVRGQGGHVSTARWGHGVAEGLDILLATDGQPTVS